MTEPVLKALREFDGKNPAMGRAYWVMQHLGKHVYALKDLPFGLPVLLA